MSSVRVYVMFCDAAETFIKVGIAIDPYARCATIQTGNPHTIDVYWFTEPMDPRAAIRIERLAQNVMQSKRMLGEWFAEVPLGVAVEVVGALVKGRNAEEVAAWFKGATS